MPTLIKFILLSLRMVNTAGRAVKTYLLNQLFHGVGMPGMGAVCSGISRHCTFLDLPDEKFKNCLCKNNGTPLPFNRENIATFAGQVKHNSSET